jgi:spore coat polysaccharide biosynthesis protein SpsF
MMHPLRVTIGIQARSSSKRLPGKVNMLIGPKTLLAHTIEKCSDSLGYLNSTLKKPAAIVQLAVCIPYGDEEIKQRYYSAQMIEGPEDDVLERYNILGDRYRSDFIVRITSDCYSIPAGVISSVVNKAVKGQFDYYTNADPRCRTTPDGWDCEVFSRKLLVETSLRAKEPHEREHVTPFMQDHAPSWAKIGVLLGDNDQSHIKYSVDTPEDFEEANRAWYRAEEIRNRAKELYGQNIGRF